MFATEAVKLLKEINKINTILQFSCYKLKENILFQLVNRRIQRGERLIKRKKILSIYFSFFILARAKCFRVKLWFSSSLPVIWLVEVFHSIEIFTLIYKIQSFVG